MSAGSDLEDEGRAASYRVLSLPGGGARGVFQARFLERLESLLGTPLHEQFDLIAATSTGAIVGLALAAGVPAERIARLYLTHATEVFAPRPLASLRRGPRYDTTRLEQLLAEELGDRRLGDLAVDVFIPASVVDTQEGRPFTRSDADIPIVDAVLASAAAPTYFAPRQVTGDHRGYADGGLWANDPGFAAIAHAISVHAVRPEAVALVSVGTGKAQRGEPAEVLANLRPLSPATIRFIFELIGTLQVWHAQQLVRAFLDDDRVIEVNPSLPRWIALDAGREAVLRLPAIADSQADHYCPAIKRLLKSPAPLGDGQIGPIANPVAVQGLAAANVLRFIPARKYYGQFREGRASITEFIAQASEELVMVSVNLMTGDPFERILETYRQMLSSEEPATKITLSLLDPAEQHLMAAIAGNLDLDPDDLAHSIEVLINKVAAFVQRLKESERERFALHCHKTIPSASAIMLDPEREWGSIQLETRSYKARGLDAFGFEVGHGSELFRTLLQSYRELIVDGRRVL